MTTSTTNCIDYALAATYWLQGFSSTMMGFVVIDLHDSHGTSRVLGQDAVLATVAVLTSVLSLLHAGFRLSCLLTHAGVGSARSSTLLLVETLVAIWTLAVFAIVAGLVLGSSERGDKCTDVGHGSTRNCRPSGYERAVIVFATVCVLVHLDVLVLFWCAKAACRSEADNTAMAATPPPLSAAKYAASSLEKPNATVQ